MRPNNGAIRLVAGNSNRSLANAIADYLERPLTKAVVTLLEQRARTEERVFPIDITKAWNTVITKIGITDFRFHDLRHCAGSALTMSGANAVEVASLLGHKTLDMVKRYSHLSSEHTTALVDRVMGGIA